MRYTRLYASPDGESHLEDVDRAIEAPSLDGWKPFALPVNRGAFFLRRAPGHARGWHTAPQRQFLAPITAEIEFETSDGSIRRFGAGTIILVEDTTGKGHQTRFLGNYDQLSLFVPLAEGALPD